MFVSIINKVFVFKRNPFDRSKLNLIEIVSVHAACWNSKEDSDDEGEEGDEEPSES